MPPVEQWPATAWVQPEPLGVVLILGAWNYPFQLLMSPLVGAIAAGNCAILKPSEHAPHTAQVVQQIVESCFESHYVAVVNGDAQVSQALVAEPFDHIFFTGGTETGRAVLAAAAQNLTPVTLELGGKSPCLVDTDIHLDSTARRIVWGKFINVGQTCVAPDYVLVHQKVKQALVARLVYYIREFYGEDPSISPDYGRIVNEKQFRRLAALLPTGSIVVGGQSNADNLYIEPTLFEPVDWADPIMQSEIFGPILPILTYTDLDTAIAQINQRPKPLALYFFSRDRRKQRQVLRSTTSGTVCLNDTVLQYTVLGLPFGGVGGSGMGSYHGKASFETFSHHKSILSRSFALDLNWRYAPYTAAKFNFLKRFITGQWL